MLSTIFKDIFLVVFHVRFRRNCTPDIFFVILAIHNLALSHNWLKLVSTTVLKWNIHLNFEAMFPFIFLFSHRFFFSATGIQETLPWTYQNHNCIISIFENEFSLSKRASSFHTWKYSPDETFEEQWNSSPENTMVKPLLEKVTRKKNKDKCSNRDASRALIPKHNTSKIQTILNSVKFDAASKPTFKLDLDRNRQLATSLSTDTFQSKPDF